MFDKKVVERDIRTTRRSPGMGAGGAQVMMMLYLWGAAMIYLIVGGVGHSETEFWLHGGDFTLARYLLMLVSALPLVGFTREIIREHRGYPVAIIMGFIASVPLLVIGLLLYNGGSTLRHPADVLLEYDQISFVLIWGGLLLQLVSVASLGLTRRFVAKGLCLPT